ncbi:18166_t:CDS:2, partial [Entrophospora sp. SA101]
MGKNKGERIAKKLKLPISGPATRLRNNVNKIEFQEEYEKFELANNRPVKIIKDERLKTVNAFSFFLTTSSPVPPTTSTPITSLTASSTLNTSSSSPPSSLPSEDSFTPRLEVLSKWSLKQQKIFLATYMKNDKDFDLIKKNLNDTKTSKEIIEFYYLVKHLPKFKSAKEIKQEFDSYNEKLKNITHFNKNIISTLFKKDDKNDNTSNIN